MAGAVHVNTKASAICKKEYLCIIGVGVVLYLAYSWRRTSVSGVSEINGHDVWKSLPNQLPSEHELLVDIPKDVIRSGKDVIINEQYQTLTVGDTSQKVTVYYREVAPLHRQPTKTRKCSVLLLHGAAFTSQNWQDIETLQLIAACGCRAVAVDLPGMGKSTKDGTQKLGSHEKRAFLEELISTLGLDKPVLVSPSMSGSFAVPFLMEDKPAQCNRRLTAFVALAPVHTDSYEHHMYHRCEIPVLIVYGTKDVTLGRESLGNLRNMPLSKIFPIQKAGHPCYIEQPDVWNRLLYNFLTVVTKGT